MKPRSSSAQAARPGAAVRSPILTRRRSSTLQRQDSLNFESATPPAVPPIALPTSRAESRNSQDGRPSLKPILPRRVVEVSSPALRAARRSSLIPLLTPVRAAIRSELASISPDTPETPSLAARVVSIHGKVGISLTLRLRRAKTVPLMPPCPQTQASFRPKTCRPS